MHWIIVLNWLTMGGAERQALLLAEELVRRGDRVSVVGFSSPGAAQDRCDELGIPCYFWPFSFAGSLVSKIRNLFDIAKQIRSLNPDYLAPYGMIPNLVCGIFWRYTGARASVWQQRDEGRARQHRFLEWLAIRLTPAFISNSEHAVDWLVGELEAPRKKIWVVRNGVEGEKEKKGKGEWETKHKWREPRSLWSEIVQAKPSEKEKEGKSEKEKKGKSEWEEKHEHRKMRSLLTDIEKAEPSEKEKEIKSEWEMGASDTLLVTMIANIHSYKDHDTLIHAWKIVIDRHQHPENLKLIFAGNKQDTWPAIEAYIRQNRLESYVDAIGSITTVSDLIDQSALIVHSSANEGVPNGILEGMALGKPIVGSDIPGIRETGIGEHPQQLFKLGDAESCAEKILFFLQHPEERERAGSMNRSIIERDFGVQRMVDETLAVFESVV